MCFPTLTLYLIVIRSISDIFLYLLYQSLRLNHRYMKRILKRPLLHGVLVDSYPHRHFISRLIQELHFFTKPVKEISQEIFLCTKCHWYALAGEHIDMFRHVFRKVQPVFQTLNFFHRFGWRIQKTDISNTIYPVIGYTIIFIIVADQIIPSIYRCDLIWINNIGPDMAEIVFPCMQLPVRIVFIILE